MRAMFKRGVPFSTGIAMAFLAALAIVAPPVAAAFVPTQEAIYCLTHDDHGIGRDRHDHHSGRIERTKHSHGDAGQPFFCCGIFHVSALAPGTHEIVRLQPVGSKFLPSTEPGVHSPTPELPFRPPIFPRLSI